MYLLTEQEHKHWNKIKQQFPYRYKSVDLIIALSLGGVVGLWIGVLTGLVIA